MSDTPASGSDSQEWTTKRLLSWTTGHLASHDVAEPRLASEVLLAHATASRRIDLYARFDLVPEPDQIACFRDLVRRAAKHEPVAYLVGKKEFYSLEFVVTPDVLIPRPETETLVEAVIDHCRATSIDRPHLLDLGTGSGCIVIAVLTQLPSARAVATDISSPALAVASRNAERYALLERLVLVEADGLNLAEDAIPADGFDVLMSNPPYVPAASMDALDRTVRDFEPELALTDAKDGLSFFHTIARDGARVLAPGGVAVVEVAAGLSETVRTIFETTSGWVHQKTIRDRVLGHERVVMFART